MTIPVSVNGALEKLFVNGARSDPSAFPSRNKDYVSSYQSIKEHLANTYYQVTGAALAEGGHRFTKHDITHVDDVIHTAGRIMGADKDGGKSPDISPYELFVLLLAILIHDAGNAYERQGHEIRAADILRNLGALSPLNDLERRLVASIASAHGGKTATGGRDTIEDRVLQDVTEVDGHRVFGRRLAALVRLADEFSERSRRADEIAISTRKPPGAFLPNYFCQTINVRIDASSRSVSMDFNLNLSDLQGMHPNPENDNKDTLIVDYISKRLEKADLERRYCNRYLAGWCPLDVFRSTISIYENDVYVGDTSATLSDTGYPTSQRPAPFTGIDMQRKYCGANHV